MGVDGCCAYQIDGGGGESDAQCECNYTTSPRVIPRATSVYFVRRRALRGGMALDYLKFASCRSILHSELHYREMSKQTIMCRELTLSPKTCIAGMICIASSAKESHVVDTCPSQSGGNTYLSIGRSQDLTERSILLPTCRNRLLVQKYK